MFAVYMFHLQDFHSEFQIRHSTKTKILVADETADESFLMTSPNEQEYDAPGWLIMSPKRISRKFFKQEDQSSIISVYNQEPDGFVVTEDSNDMMVNSSEDLGLKLHANTTSDFSQLRISNDLVNQPKV